MQTYKKYYAKCNLGIHSFFVKFGVSIHFWHDFVYICEDIKQYKILLCFQSNTEYYNNLKLKVLQPYPLS